MLTFADSIYLTRSSTLKLNPIQILQGREALLISIWVDGDETGVSAVRL